MTTKCCNNKNCRQSNPQPVTNFFRDKSNKTDGRYSICKTCKTEHTLAWRVKKKLEYNAYMRTYRKTHPVKYDLDRNRGLRRRYKITQRVYNEILMDQGGTCALCDIRPTNRPLHVDHDHKTGRVRGLLCPSHNRSIAILDDIDLLERAMEYIRVPGYSGTGCYRCGGIDEPYMLNDEIWSLATTTDNERFLCLQCVEKQLGRKLELSDFAEVPINYGIFGFNCLDYVKKNVA